MAKTSRFPVTVVVGDKTYAPGAPVPIGKTGLSEEEAAGIEAAHGTWDNSAVAARTPASADDSAAIEKAVAAAEAKHAKALAAIGAAWADVQASLAADEGTDAAAALADRMAALTALAPQG